MVEANAVLSDAQRRERYDMGEDEDGMSDAMGGMHGMDLSELFAQFHGGGGGFPGGGASFGGSFGGFGGGGRSHSHGGGHYGF